MAKHSYSLETDGKAQVLRGDALRLAGDLCGAVEAYRQALLLNPRCVEAYNHLGNIFASLHDRSTAVTFYQAALAIQPDLAEIHNNLANIQMAAGELEAAAAGYCRALALRPGTAVYQSQLGNALRLLGRGVEAEACLREVAALHPGFAGACVNLGLVLAERGECAEAETWYRRAIELDPKLALAHVSLAMMLLKRGELADGWGEQEWRWQWPEFPSPQRCFPQPPWRGEPIAGATVLLHAEQGFGDAIQFVRYVPMVVALGAQVFLEAPTELARLFACIKGVAQVISRGEPLPVHDWHCPLMSLPLAFDTTLATIPAQVPYLQANAPAPWAGAPAGHLRVGLAWAGNAKSSVDPRRSVTLAALAPLWSVPGVGLYSLQLGSGESDFVGRLPDTADFADTAAVMETLDLVISVDTAVAHLAGALGKPVWILLPKVAEWRWLEDQDDSPWYPTARLFRQQSDGDWQELVERVRAALAELAYQRARA